ncbi:MAG: post-COAP-1 domain-containing protein [Gammaproteobacteria bacterium]
MRATFTRNRALAQGMALLFLLTGVATATHAAAPPSGDIGPNGPTLNWAGTATGGASLNESTCVEGVNCDTFTINVLGSEADWTGTQIAVTIAWTLPATDYDVVLHKDSNDGPIVGTAGDGAPDTEEVVAITPSSTGVGTYTVHVVYFTAVGDQYSGTAAVIEAGGGRTAKYKAGGVDFSANVTVKAPVAARDGEPSNRTDKFGNHYAGAIRGVPAGVDLWYFDLNPDSPTYDPFMRNPIYRGQPDSFTQDEALAVGADGGGDIDLAVGFDAANPGAPPILAYSSLVAANISTGRSLDRGETFQLNPLGNLTGGAPGDDRQWLEFFGDNSVYLLYRTLVPAVTMIQRSNDGGLTYGPATTAGAIGQVGQIDVDQNDGSVYISGSSGQVCVGTPAAPELPPATYTCNQAAEDPNGVAHIFFVVKVADDGTAYVVYSNDKDIFIAHSFDKGANWSEPVRVSNGAATRTSVFPWIETGPAPGSVGVVWYGTDSPTNSDDANWEVFYAVSFNATDQSPTFRQAIASDHVIHGSNISEGGLDPTGGANRNLLDYFQVSFDPLGAAVISYTDDHNDFDGHTFVTRQIRGPSVLGKGRKVPRPVEGGQLPPPPAPPADGSQVEDFAQDVAIGLLGVVPADDPLDILSIRYTCSTSEAGDELISAAMRVSDLTVVPPASNWRMNFTANAPFSVLSPTGDYTFGLSDRGDQFFVRASTDAAGASSFEYGTAVRNSDGSIAYTTQGSATGSFDTMENVITVAVPLSDLNALLDSDPIGDGSILVGLRGQAFTSGANAKRDLSRGGTQFTVGTCDGGDGGGPGGSGGGGGATGPIIKATGGDSFAGKAVNFSFNADHVPGGHLNYEDMNEDIHLVSQAIETFTQLSDNRVQFTGQGRVDRDPVSFAVTVEDNGEPGAGADTIHVQISGARNSSRSGTLERGDIQLHR